MKVNIIAVSCAKERGPGNAHHAYAVLTQDGEKTLMTVDFQNGPIKELKRVAGTQLDPELVKVFVEMVTSREEK